MIPGKVMGINKKFKNMEIFIIEMFLLMSIQIATRVKNNIKNQCKFIVNSNVNP